MSVITHLIVQIPMLEQDEKQEEVFKIFDKYEFQRPTDMNLPNGKYAGTKVWCLATYYGCYNYFISGIQLLDELSKIKWENPEEVKIFYESENLDIFQMDWKPISEDEGLIELKLTDYIKNKNLLQIK